MGSLRGRGLAADTSDGVPFPTNVKVSKQQAEAACAALTDQKQNCITDVRMANDPAVTDLLVKDFANVEDTLTKLQNNQNIISIGGQTTPTPPTAAPTIPKVTIPPTAAPTI